MRISDWSSDVCSSDLVLDPADVKGPDYPSETFRVLKKNEIARYGEYRTARLVLQAWDEQEKGVAEDTSPLVTIAARPIVPVQADLAILANGTWANSGNFQIGRASCRERVCQYV